MRVFDNGGGASSFPFRLESANIEKSRARPRLRPLTWHIERTRRMAAPAVVLFEGSTFSSQPIFVVIRHETVVINPEIDGRVAGTDAGSVGHGASKP